MKKYLNAIFWGTLACFSVDANAGGFCELTKETQKMLDSQKIKLRESERGNLSFHFKKTKFEFLPAEEYQTIQTQSYVSILNNDINGENKDSFGKSFDLKEASSMQLQDRKGNAASIKFKSVRIDKYEDTSGTCEISSNLQYGLQADILLSDRNGKNIVKSKIDFNCSQSHMYVDKHCALEFEDEKN